MAENSSNTLRPRCFDREYLMKPVFHLIMPKLPRARLQTLVLSALAISISIQGCSIEDDIPSKDGGKASSKVLIYKLTGQVQCGPSVADASENARYLADNNVRVIDSFCGVQTGVFFPAVCGGKTGKLYLHWIDASDLETTKSLGYDRADSLEKSGEPGFQIVECPPPGDGQPRFRSS